MAVRAKAGKLFLDFRWRDKRCREFTGLPDTVDNRRKLRAFDMAIAGEIAMGTSTIGNIFRMVLASAIFTVMTLAREVLERCGSAITSTSGTSGARHSSRTGL